MRQFKRAVHLTVLGTLLWSSAAAVGSGGSDEQHCAYYEAGTKQVYWGDLHVHSGFSLDAWGYGTARTPREAYGFARGAPTILPGGHAVQLERPLDFMSVTDHAEWFDLMSLCTDPNWSENAYCRTLTEKNTPATGREVFTEYVLPTITKANPQPAQLCVDQPARCAASMQQQWRRIQRQAHQANRPCEFTAFVGFEWSATPDYSHTHRNVIFASENVTSEPIDYLRYPSPDKLWQELDQRCLRAEGCDVLVIPHNTNMGDGKSFDVETESADLRSRRARYEKLIEIHQEKGNSECLPAYGQADEDCGFETILTRHSQPTAATDFTAEEWQRMRGTYVRRLLLRGLRAYDQSGGETPNPLQLGIIGSTDNHAGTGGFVEEDQWLGSVFGIGDFERTMARRSWNPGGLVAVWAEENTRSSIFAALSRREVYATSGPRLRLRFMAATEPLSCDGPPPEHAVTMGGELSGRGERYFMVHAQYDRTPLRAIEIVKGSYRQGELREQVKGIWQRDGGGLDVCVTWQDDAFDYQAPAFWYARVHEAPTPRWSARHCRQAGRCDEFRDADVSISERAWSSPIWNLP